MKLVITLESVSSTKSLKTKTLYLKKNFYFEAKLPVSIA